MPSARRRDDHAKLVSRKVLGHPVAKGSGITGPHKHGNDVLTFDWLTTELLAAQKIVSDIANQMCSLKSCGQLNVVEMCGKRNSGLLDACRHQDLGADRLT